MMMRLLCVCAICLFANAFQMPPRISVHRGAPTRRTRLNQKETFVSSQQDTKEIDKSQDILLGGNLLQKSSSEYSMDSVAANNAGMSDGLAWRGVVGVLCALWASNFAAAKLIIAEPGVDSSLYAGMSYIWVY
jgi:hypothetical protein